MKFLLRLVTNLLPIQTMIFGQSDDVPTMFNRVITNDGNFVITSRSAFLIAKKYV